MTVVKLPTYQIHLSTTKKLIKIHFLIRIFFFKVVLLKIGI